MRAISRKGICLVAVSAACTLASLPPATVTAGAEDSTIPTVHPRLFANAPVGASKPDDITKLGALLYVTYQNNAGKDGTPPGSKSTIVAFDESSGAIVATYAVTGRCDGLTADPIHRRLLASVNEDNNSSLFVITPGNPTPAHYVYSPDPAQTGSDGTNGGTDAISVSPDGTIYVAHSNPDGTLPPPNNPAAVYAMTLADTTATLAPVFGVNNTAEIVNPTGAQKSAPLGLTDPDSNRFVPGEDGGTLIQVAQADSKLVFASNLGQDHPALRELTLANATAPMSGPATPQLDDIERVTGRGTLYVVDQKTGSIYAIDTAAVEPGTFFVSQPNPAAGDLPNDPALGVVDLHSGVVTHVDATFGSPKGLLFVPAHRQPDDGEG